MSRKHWRVEPKANWVTDTQLIRHLLWQTPECKMACKYHSQKVWGEGEKNFPLHCRNRCWQQVRQASHLQRVCLHSKCLKVGLARVWKASRIGSPHFVPDGKYQAILYSYRNLHPKKDKLQMIDLATENGIFLGKSVFSSHTTRWT